MPFQRPSKKQTLAAIGDVSALSAQECAAYSVDESAFSRLPARPAVGDWLYSHDEQGQTYKSYARRSFKCSPHGHCDSLYIVPIGDFHPSRSPPLDDLVAFAGAHFGCKVKVHPQIKLDKVMLNSRIGDEGQLQLDTETVREFLCRGMKPPRDSFCLLGITMQDLYTIKDGEAWNFVFGQASAMDGVGVFSFARYDPSGSFVSQEGSVDSAVPMDEGQRAKLLHRCCRVLCHEGSHVVGLKHCIHFHCLMNGSNHLAESDRCPLHLCPVCLRKLAEGCGFEPLQRYQMLAAWYGSHVGFETQFEWTEQRIQSILIAVQEQSGGRSFDDKCNGKAAPPQIARPLSDGVDNGKTSAVAVLAKAPGRTAELRDLQANLELARHAPQKTACPLFRCRGKRGCICPMK